MIDNNTLLLLYKTTKNIAYDNNTLKDTYFSVYIDYSDILL